MPVLARNALSPSSSTVTSMAVSRVRRSTRARRASRARTISGQDSPAAAGCRTRRPRTPRLAASCRSLSRSPITALRAASRPWSRRHSRNIPVCGLRQSQPSPARCGQMQIASKAMPWAARVRTMNSWQRSKSARGNDAVPSPSWLVTMTKRKPASRRAASAANTPGRKRIFSSASTCASAGSSTSVPSRSMNRVGADSGAAALM